MKQLEKISICIFLSVPFFILSCGQKGALVKVQNSSGMDLKKIVISGNGFSNTISKLENNKSTTIEIFPKGESSLTVQFISNNKEYNLPQDTYFEGTGHYTVDIEIQPDLTVKVDVKL